MPQVLLPYSSDIKVHPYVRALQSVGLEPVLVYSGAPQPFGDASGLLLAGGTDVDPALYGAALEPETEPPDHDRDQLELHLLTEALERDLPVLAICRGHQLLNVHQGGSLRQHIPSGKHAVRGPDASQPVHTVTLSEDSTLARVFGASEVHVNSRHHQAIQDVAPSLRIAGRSTQDGLVEALEHPSKRFLISVQWHPEDQIERCEKQRLLFEAFAQALQQP